MKIKIELNFGWGLGWLGCRLERWLDKRRRKRLDAILGKETQTESDQEEVKSLLDLLGGKNVAVGD